jgi:hypothetical protein
VAYAPAAIEKFGGLRLSTDPGDVSLEQSLAGVNCTLGPDRSFLRSRDGTARLGADGAMTGDVCQRLIATQGTFGGDVLLAVSRTGSTSYLDSYDVLGTLTALANWSSSQPFNDAVSIGTPAAQVAYIASSGATLRKHTLGVVATAPGKPKYLSVTPTSNRLVQAHYLAAADSPSGANGTRSTVFFSDAGAPDTYQPNNYVMLQPGDGSDIRGVTSWGRQIFVFKQGDMFVFSGESIDATGQPIFDYRAVSLPSLVAPEVSSAYGQVVASGALGVYYVGVDGIYRTTGGPPVRVSGALSEGFRVNGAIRPSALAAIGQRVLVQQPGTIYELDERHGEWMAREYPQFGDAFVAPWVQWPGFENIGSWDTETLFYGGGATLLYTSGKLATDDGSAVASSYQSGYGDLGAPGIKRLRQSVLAGTGSVRYSVGWDYAALDAGSIATLGAGTAGYWMDRAARRGRLLSFGLSASGGGWRVNGIQMQLGPTRSPARMIA